MVYAVIVGAAVLSFFPIYYTIITAFKPPQEVLAYPPKFFPASATLKNYEYMIFIFGLKGLLNSFVIASSSTVLTVALGSFAAYGLARFHFRGNRNLAVWILSQRMFPPIAAVIPFFIIFNTLHLLDTHIALIIVYTAFNLPFFVWMMRDFLMSIPTEIEESALVDGASRLRTFITITLRLAAPGVFALAIIIFIFCWNEFLFAFMLVRSDAKTLPIEFAGLRTIRGVEWGNLCSLATLVIIPAILVTIFAQKYIVRGLTFGAVKG